MVNDALSGRDCWSKLVGKESVGWVTWMILVFRDDDHHLEGGSQTSPILWEGLERKGLEKNRREHEPGDCGRL